MDEQIPKMSDMGVIRRLALKLISKLQKQLLKSPAKSATNLYYKLAKIHFKLYFKKDLEQEVLNDTVAAYKAIDRHSRLVIKSLYNDKDEAVKKHLAAATRGAFVKNIILNAEL